VTPGHPLRGLTKSTAAVPSFPDPLEKTANRPDLGRDGDLRKLELSPGRDNTSSCVITLKGSRDKKFRNKQTNKFLLDFRWWCVRGCRLLIAPRLGSVWVSILRVDPESSRFIL